MTNRDYSAPGVFAETAETTIPGIPLPGVSYRDAINGLIDVANGWQYDRPVDSKDFNQLVYLITKIIDELDRRGILTYSTTTMYAPPAIVWGSNNQMYRCLLPNGPGSIVIDPVTDATFTYWEEFGEDSMGVPLGGVTRFPYSVGSSTDTTNHNWTWAKYPRKYLQPRGQTLLRADYPDLAALIANTTSRPIDQISVALTGYTGLVASTAISSNARYFGGYLVANMGAHVAVSSNKGVSWATGTSAPAQYSQGGALMAGGFAWIGGSFPSSNSLFKISLSSPASVSTINVNATAGGSSTYVIGANGSNIWVSLGSEIWKSIDAGVSWSLHGTVAALFGTIVPATVTQFAARSSVIFRGSTVADGNGIYETQDWTTFTYRSALNITDGVTFDGAAYWFVDSTLNQLYKTTDWINYTAIGSAAPNAGYVAFGDGAIFISGTGSAGCYSVTDGAYWLPYAAGTWPVSPKVARGLLGVDKGLSLMALDRNAAGTITYIEYVELGADPATNFTMPVVHESSDTNMYGRGTYAVMRVLK